MSKEKIERLRERIRKLKEASQGEVLTSYKEATQTQLTIEAYEKHLTNLETEQEEVSESTKVVLKNEAGTREFIITIANPDPSKGIITDKSPLGKNLLKLKIGDKVNIGEHEFTIHSKDPYNHNFDK